VKLWIDADAAPRDVKEIVFRASERLRLPTVLVANQRVLLPPGYAFLSAVRVDGGPDVADRHIAEEATVGDVVVTADIPLAAVLVAKGAIVLDPRGTEFTANNVGERLTMRDFMEGLRGAGVETGGPQSYGPREKSAGDSHPSQGAQGRLASVRPELLPPLPPGRPPPGAGRHLHQPCRLSMHRQG
jgi:hypothetical protein